MPRSAATVGMRPTMTNSVVPMAKALRVSASRAMGMGALFLDGEECLAATFVDKRDILQKIIAEKSNINVASS